MPLVLEPRDRDTACFTSPTFDVKLTVTTVFVDDDDEAEEDKEEEEDEEDVGYTPPRCKTRIRITSTS